MKQPEFDIDQDGRSGAPMHCYGCDIDVWARFSFVKEGGIYRNSLDCSNCMEPIAIERGGIWEEAVIVGDIHPPAGTRHYPPREHTEDITEIEELEPRNGRRL